MASPLGGCASSGFSQRTVLVVGVSQHGKSKTIGAVQEGQGVVENNPVVGEGIAAKTKAPAFHNAHRAGEATRLPTVNPWDPAAAKLGSGDAYSQLTQSIADASVDGPDLVRDCDAQMARHSRFVWSEFQYDVSYKAKPGLAGPLIGRDGSKIQLRLVDTAGPESSDDRDDENMAQVLEALVQCSSEVACVLLVAQVGLAFSVNWVKQAQRYWLQFPPLRTQWVVVHTRAEPLGARSCEWEKQDSCFERDCFIRVQALTDHFRKFMGDDADSVRHVFMEHCTPGASEFRVPPGYEAIRHFQVKTQVALLRHIADFSPVPLGELPYHKSEGMQRVDEKISEWLRDRDDEASRREVLWAGELVVHMKNKEKNQMQLDATKSKLSELREEKMTTFQTFSAETAHKLNPFRQETFTRRVDVNYQTVQIETSKSKWWRAQCKSEVVMLSHCNAWEVRITSPPFRAVSQNVKLLTTSADKNREEIEFMLKEISRLGLQVIEVDAAIQRVEASLREVREQRQHFHDMKAQIRQDMTLAEYGRTRDFYKQAEHCRSNGEECCRLLAAALSMALPHGLYKIPN